MTVQAALPASTAAAPSRSDAGDAQPRDAASEALEGDCQGQLYEFLQRYFGQGQQRAPAPQAAQQPGEDVVWMSKKLVWERPRWAGIAIPAFFVYLFWWSYMVNNSELFSLFGGGTGDG